MAQRFSSDLKLNLHWHVLLADGVWTEQDGQATFRPAAPLDTMRVQETHHDAVLRIDKVLKRKRWQDRTDDSFAESEPALAELWKAALHGCWRPPRRFHSRGGRSARRRDKTPPPLRSQDQPTARRVSDPGPAGVAARLSVATAGSKSPRFPTKPPSTGGRSATGRR